MCGGPLNDAYHATSVRLDCLSAHTGPDFWPFLIAAVVLIAAIGIACGWRISRS